MDKNEPSNKINGKFKGKDILSLDQFSPSDLRILFSHTKAMREIARKAKPSKILEGTITTLLFYEPSSRTFGSFSAAIKQLNGKVIDVLNPQQFSSVSKGETLEDTIRVFEAYCDAIVIRHPVVGTAKKAADAAFFVPVINGGDGTSEHPTQALLDLYTIYEKLKRLDNLKVLMAGDILNGRTVHSLIRGLSLYKNNTVFLLSPLQLRLDKKDHMEFTKRGIKLVEISHEEEIPKDADVWYWTRVQKERFTDVKAFIKVFNRFVVTKKMLATYGNKNMILMHPLPRVGEISTDVDEDKRAVYLRSQIRNGMYIRMALVALILNKIS